MTNKLYTKIIGTGSCIPTKVIKNDYFLGNTFYNPSTHEIFDKSNEEIIRKFHDITNIEERRYVEDDQLNSDIATIAVNNACESSGVDPESLEFIIFCHNFGNITKGKALVDTLPALANLVKKAVGIKNPGCICHDLISGCPGWTQGMITANAYLTSGTYKRGIVIGADTLSRVSDPHDRDTMIFSDGAGATIVEAVESETPIGIVSHSSRSDSNPYANLLTFGRSLNPDYDPDHLFIKMTGHKLYVYAITYVPLVVKDSLDKAGIDLKDIKKVLIHQANEKMDEAILRNIFKLYNRKEVPEGLMPMSINKLGNSSTATVPTLLDLVAKGKLDDHRIQSGDYVLMCSVGAGMNINSIVYKWN